MPLSSTVKGVDVSHWQRTVDWSKVSTSGIKFAMAKATDGVAFIDPQFKANWSGMKTVKILRGATHYFRSNRDPVAQAKHFIAVVGTLDPNDLPPVLDIETFDGAYGSEGLVKNVQVWLDTVEHALKRKPIIYTGPAFWNKYMSDQFGDYPLWITEYGVLEPKLPIGWSSWTFWQSTDKGTVEGIQSRVDMDMYNGTLIELIAHFQVTSNSESIADEVSNLSDDQQSAGSGTSLPANTNPVLPLTHIVEPIIQIDDQLPAANLIQNSILSDGSRDTSSGMRLFTGVGGQGCLYLALSGISAASTGTLTLYAEVSVDNISQGVLIEETIGYFCWAKSGWQLCMPFKDDTNDLTRSGIIEFDISALPINQSDTILPYLPSPVMPNQDFWLAITTERKGVKLSYLNTQALKLTRASLTSLSVGEIPQISANAINATQPKVAKIASIEQPFPSFGGLASETKDSYDQSNSFYLRVSGRLNHKDRSSSSTDYVTMAYEACPNLFYVKILKDPLGTIRIGLVNGYANAQLPNAFAPVVNTDDQSTILNHITTRKSAMAKFSVFNLEHQAVKIEVTVVVDSQADTNELALSLNQNLKLYLSPWISSDLPTLDMEQGINRSALISFIRMQDHVIIVSELKIRLADDLVISSVDNDQFVSVLEDPVMPRKVLSQDDELQRLQDKELQILQEEGQGTIFVSAIQHKITITRGESTLTTAPRKIKQLSMTNL